MNWRARAATVFQCEKQPASGNKGMVVTNHPLASAAAAEILAGGGNAIDAATAAMFTLTVVEPMMVGVLGGGMTMLQLADGTRQLIDANCCAPSASSPDMYTPLEGVGAENFNVQGSENSRGARSVAAPGALKGWCDIQRRKGTLSLADVIEPAIRHARRGFLVTPYLSSCIADAAEDLLLDRAISNWLLPSGTPLKAGERLANPAYADALTMIGRQGESALHGGQLGDAFLSRLNRDNGVLCKADLVGYEVKNRQPLAGHYRNWEVIAPPPPSASGVHILQMLKILEGFDIAGIGFGTIEGNHLLAEAMKIAFSDRAVSTGDPDFQDVPVDLLMSADYAAERRQQIKIDEAQQWFAGQSKPESKNTTHITIADAEGNVVASTQTISASFGARILVEETGMIPNNYMAVFDPRPGNAQSIVPGKRVTTSMGPTFLLHSGVIKYAMGLPGGKRIFPSMLQTIINIVDHGMGIQEAIEAPRIWTEGPVVEAEDAIPERVLRGLRLKGHKVKLVPHIAGGMNGIQFLDDSMLGAGCWRADGTALAIGGGLARPDVRFWPDESRAVPAQ